jgi:hypothetical protein
MKNTFAKKVGSLELTAQSVIVISTQDIVLQNANE